MSLQRLIPTTLDIGNNKGFSMGISRDVYGSHNKVRYFLFLYSGKSAVTQGGGSAKAYLKEKSGSSVFHMFKFEDSKWTSISNSSSVEFTDGNLMIVDTLPIVETSNCIFYKYSFTTGAISKQIGEIQQQITTINNNYNILNEQVAVLDTKVNDLQNENNSVSQKMDTVINNQQNTLDYLQKTPTDESTKNGIDSIFSSGEISSIFPQQEGKYDTQLENVVSSFTDALKNNKSTVNFSFAGRNYTVDINVLNNMYDGVPQLKALIQLITISFITWQIVKEIEKITDAYNSFNFVEVTDSISNVHYTDIF